jgi:hypothetical protein
MTREIADCVTDSEGDWWPLQTMREIVDFGTDQEGDGWLCQNAGGCWLLQWGRLLTVSQTMREIVDCGIDPEGDWLLLIMRVADCVTENVGYCWLTDLEGDCWLCYRPWGRLLTLAQVMREIADCGTDHEGDGWLTHTEGHCWLCHRPWGKLLSVSQLTLNTAYHLCTLVLTLYNVHIILSKSSMNHRWFWTVFHTKFD